jgi:hypothetical protein
MTWHDTNCAINWYHPLEGLFAPQVMLQTGDQFDRGISQTAVKHTVEVSRIS